MLLTHIAQKVTYPLSYLISHIQTVKEGNWVPIREIPCNDEVASLLSSFNSMIAIQTKMRDDLIEAEKLKQQLSLNLLQQQVNPHFFTILWITSALWRSLMKKKL